MLRFILNHHVLTLIVLAVCLWMGFELSKNRYLWNDELYTQTFSIDPVSYTSILKGAVQEGNNRPLFYILQKSICDAFHYTFPGQWQKEWYIYEMKSQIILRILSNIFMSASIALIFYYFLRSYSLGIALLGLVVSLSNPMVWLYWVEARPYSLWIFLTTAQVVCFLFLTSGSKRSKYAFLCLGLINLCLVLTISLAFVQVLLIAFMCWLYGERRWWCHLYLTGLPFLISLYYHANTAKYNFWFREGPAQLIFQNIPSEYFLAFICYGAVMLINHKSKIKSSSTLVYVYIIGFLSLLTALGLLLFLKIKSDPGTTGFAISARYFLFLVPIAVLSLTFCFLDLWNTFKNNRWMRLNLVIFALGVIIMSALKTHIAILSSGSFVHVIK